MSRLAHDACRLSAAAALAAILVAVPPAIAIAQPAISRMPGVGPTPMLPAPHHSPSAVNFALLPDGSLLVADDAGNTVWRVQAVD